MLSRSFPITILLYLAAVEPLIAMTTACSSNRLLNQRVLITGGGRGIGRALALICSREGAKVAITSRTRSELEETASHAAAAAAGANLGFSAIPPSTSAKVRGDDRWLY
mmetsp:Transcript_19590/g.41072  ORF Transcript_19590/g.41072 Transcript_19590/m.41072 type:complete len:109 (-) Transcript_19590:142-468(-)